MLGGFFFETQENGYQKLIEKLTFEYAEHYKALNFREDEDIGGYEESWDMEGTLILQNIYSLEELKNIAKEKVPVLLVFGNGFAFWVTIREIEIESTRFLRTGEQLKRDFKVKLKRYYYEQSIFSQIFSAF